MILTLITAAVMIAGTAATIRHIDRLASQASTEEYHLAIEHTANQHEREAIVKAARTTTTGGV